MPGRETEPLVTLPLQGDYNDEYTTPVSESDMEATTPAKLISRKEPQSNISLWDDTDVRQKLLLMDLMLMDFLTLFSSSIPSPFFSRIVIKRGGSILYSALILQSLMLSFSICCVIIGKYLPSMGIKKMFVGGLATFGLCQVIFGLLHFVMDIKAFTGLGILIRVLQGAGEAAFAISSMSVICEEYPAHITKVFGFTEAMVGVGYLMGPIFGGGMFDTLGMLLPLVLSGGIVILSIPCHFFLLRPYTHEETAESGEFNVLDWLSNPYIISVLCSVATVFGTFGYIDVAITTYLEKLGFTVTTVGLVLFTVGLSYCIAAALIGYIVSFKVWVRKVSMTVGFIGFSLVLMVYVPKQLTFLIYVGSSALGIFGALGTVPAFEDLLPSDSDPSLEIHSAISGAWYGCIGLGMFVLPLIGSAIHKVLHSFSWALFVLSCIGFAITLILAGLVYFIKRVKSSSHLNDLVD
uniref:MFS-type transporter SLC18B1-like n=1 Tax=Styela clava TaxID=7725 RepID=UPI00193960BD|nr:MFS-type transporter SLC18B1-like [Styela clava]